MNFHLYTIDRTRRFTANLANDFGLIGQRASGSNGQRAGRERAFRTVYRWNHEA